MSGEVRVVRLSATPLKIEPEPENCKHAPLNSDPDFGLFFILCFIISIVTFVMDLVMHCWLAYVFHTKKELLYFLMTVTFIIIPSIVSTGFSMRWYILDEDDELSPARSSLSKWSIRICTILLQVTQIHRYCEALLYGLRSSVAGYRKQQMKQDYFYRKMLDEDCDAALLRLFYCVLSSAPQAVLQLTILLLYKMQEFEDGRRVRKFVYTDKCTNMFEYQCISVSVSVFSVAWSLTAYDRTVRHIRDDKNRLSFVGTLLNFLSHFTWAVSRIFALAVLAALYPYLALLGFALHSSLMSGWLLYKQGLYHNRCEECVLDCMLGIAYIFIFISSHSGPQRYSYFWYYLICFAENIGCLCVWYQHMSQLNYELYYSLIVIQISSFFFSLFFLLLYYKCFHPNRKYVATQQFEMTEAKREKNSC